LRRVDVDPGEVRDAADVVEGQSHGEVKALPLRKNRRKPR
jgi:hypothetical protein